MAARASNDGRSFFRAGFLELASHVVERAGEAAADRVVCGDYRDADQGSDEAILDRRGAVFVLQGLNH